jgi:hypothetical protein
MFGTQENALAKKSALADYLLESDHRSRTVIADHKLNATQAARLQTQQELNGSPGWLAFRTSFHVAMRWDKRYGYGLRLQVPKPSNRRCTRRLWQKETIERYLLAWAPVCRFRLCWMRTPDFALSSGEPDA